jgi:hypothetical protein
LGRYWRLYWWVEGAGHLEGAGHHALRPRRSGTPSFATAIRRSSFARRRESSNSGIDITANAAASGHGRICQSMSLAEATRSDRRASAHSSTTNNMSSSKGAWTTLATCRSCCTHVSVHANYRVGIAHGDTMIMAANAYGSNPYGPKRICINCQTYFRRSSASASQDLFCSDKCWDAHNIPRFLEQVSRGTVARWIVVARRSHCPECSQPGPLDLFETHWVVSVPGYPGRANGTRVRWASQQARLAPLGRSDLANGFRAPCSPRRRVQMRVDDHLAARRSVPNPGDTTVQQIYDPN